MSRFNKRVFGAEVSQEIIDELKILGGVESAAQQDPLSSVSPSEPYYLGNQTSFARMWTAVAYTEYTKNEWEAYLGEKVSINSKGQIFFHPTDDEFESSVILGSEANTTTKLIFSANENRESSYSTSPLEETLPGSDTGTVQYRGQLTNNPLNKPPAGITSVQVKTQGALGATLSTTVQFVVHNRFDFENIFLPYFMRPGSKVCVDYGWSDPSFSLYDIKSQVEHEDIRMTKFTEFIENTFIENNYGKVNTVMGNVVNYESSITSEGSFECSIEIISPNAALLDQGVGKGDNIQFLFTNVINDLVATMFARHRGVPLSLEHIKRNLKSSVPIDTTEQSKRLISELSNNQYLGIIPPLSVADGIFHQDLAPNKAVSVVNLQDRKVTSDDDKKSARQLIVDDATLSNEVTYISYGMFEDAFLNNFVAGLVINKPKGGKVAEINFEKQPTSDFTHKFDSRAVYVRFDELFYDIQQADLIAGEKLTDFIIPDNWDDSYNSRKLTNKDFKEDESDIKWLTSTADCKAGKHPNYPGIPVIPLRDVFISVPLITAAFKKSKSVNDALVAIFDDLNFESNDVWNLKIVGSTNSRVGIKIIDINLVPRPDPQRLVFDVTGPSSIVSNVDLKYSTPSDGLSSILAIGNSSGPDQHNNMDLAQFAFLNLLKKPEFGPMDRPMRVVSLPYDGDPNSLTTQQEAMTLDLNALADSVIPTPSTVLTPEQVEIQRYYVESIVQKIDEIEKEKKGGGDFKFEASDKYDKYTKAVEFVDSYRDYYKKILKKTYFDKEGEQTIPVILPIELSLTIYGNTYLQYGDYFTVNYLPDFYKGRVFFQIVGIEDTIDTSGWSTTYQTVMRVVPAKKSIITGQKGVKDGLLSLDPNLDPLSTTTSVANLLGGGPLKEQTSIVIDAISRKRFLKKNPKTTTFENVIKTSGLTFKTLLYEIDQPSSWQGKVKIGKQLDATNFVKFQYSSYDINHLTSADELAYCFAVRDAIIGKDTPLDWNNNLGGLVMTQDFYKKTPFEIINYFNLLKSDYGKDKPPPIDFIIDIDKGKSFDGKTDFIEVFNDKIDFNFGLDPMLVKLKNIGGEFAPALNQIIFETKFDNLDDGGALTYEDTKIPMPIRGIYTALSADPNIDYFQTLYVFHVTSGNKVFQRIPIPAKFFKDQNTSEFIKVIAEKYTAYKQFLS